MCGREFCGDKDRVFCSRDCARMFGYERRCEKLSRDNASLNVLTESGSGGFEKLMDDSEIMKGSDIATIVSNT